MNDVCLSSGFGLRGSRMHEGIDLTSRPASMIYTAAPGRVIEARESSGYGLQVLVDHGHGVYTRYAHLEYFDAGIQLGSSIGFGQNPLENVVAGSDLTARFLKGKIRFQIRWRARWSWAAGASGVS